jgi:hypothetical protein
VRLLSRADLSIFVTVTRAGLTELTQLASFERLDNLCQSGHVLAQNTRTASTSEPSRMSLVMLNAVESISAPFPLVSGTDRKSPQALKQSDVDRAITG